MSISITIILVAITVLVSLFTMSNNDLKYKMMFIPFSIHNQKGQSYRFFSHLFVHGDWMHLFFNMYVLYAFGEFVENSLFLLKGDAIGSTHFLILYFGGGLFATLIPYARNKNNPNYLSLGASGAVSAIVFACIILGPQLKMGLLFLPIMIPGYIFGLLYLAFEFFMDKRGNTGIAHDAHIGGAIFGILFISLTEPVVLQNFIHYIFN
jgi:membrane associated rhomboid family serine protease